MRSSPTASPGHGLVREDMHTGSVSHLGIVVLPALLALAEQRGIDGPSFVAAAIVGYEVGGRSAARWSRPNSPDPSARPASPARLLPPRPAPACSDSTRRRPQNALSLAANMVGGQNQWPHTGADEMFFEAGIAARNGLTAARLADSAPMARRRRSTARRACSPPIGRTGTAPRCSPFDGEPEILSVFFKPVPVCNFAQTPCARGDRARARGTASIRPRSSPSSSGLPRRQGLSRLRLCRALRARPAGQDEHPLCRGGGLAGRPIDEDELSRTSTIRAARFGGQDYGRGG